MFSNKAHADLCAVHLKHHLNVSFTRQKQWFLSLGTAGPCGGDTEGSPRVPARRPGWQPPLSAAEALFTRSLPVRHGISHCRSHPGLLMQPHGGILKQPLLCGFIGWPEAQHVLSCFCTLGLWTLSSVWTGIQSNQLVHPQRLGPLCGVSGLCICAPSRRAAASPSEGHARPCQPRQVPSQPWLRRAPWQLIGFDLRIAAGGICWVSHYWDATQSPTC